MVTPDPCPFLSSPDLLGGCRVGTWLEHTSFLVSLHYHSLILSLLEAISFLRLVLFISLPHG